MKTIAHGKIVRRKTDNAISLARVRRWFAEEEKDAKPETQPEKTADKGVPDTTVTMSQEALDALIAERLRRDRESAQRKEADKLTALLQDLQIENPDALKAVVTDYRKRKEAEMSEAEKAQAALEQEQKRAAELQQKLNDMETQQRKAQRKAAVLDALRKANAQQPEDAYVIATTVLGISFDDAFAEDGTPDTKLIEQQVAKAKQDRPALFQPSAPGSPSNANGKPPVTNTQQVLETIMKRYGRL